MMQQVKLKRQIELIVIATFMQFMNTMSFVIIIPMGVFWFKSLNIDPGKIGYIVGGYSIASAVSVFISSFFMDKFGRKNIALFLISGLTVSSFLVTKATGFYSMFFAQILAGLFRGPTTPITLTIITDLIPENNRSKAISTVMGAFTIATIIGIPISLVLSKNSGWQTPFYGMALIGIIILAYLIIRLPKMKEHVADAKKHKSNAVILSFFKKDTHVFSFFMVFISILGTYLIYPNITSYLSLNEHMTTASIGKFFIYAGLASFITLQISGRMSDKFGVVIINNLSTAIMCITIFLGFIDHMFLPVLIIFAFFIASSSNRTVLSMSLSSRVPKPYERATFMSLQTTGQYIAASIGSFLSSAIVTVSNNKLINIHALVFISFFIILLHPIIMIKAKLAITCLDTPKNKKN